MFHRKDPEGRIPPGQHMTRGWPVLHEGPVPQFDPATWRLRLWGAVEKEVELTWDELRGLPVMTDTSDIHCVTSWSKLDNTWEGVAFTTVEALAQPTAEATHALLHAPFGYTANLPLEALRDDDVLLAWSHDGEPLEPIHGGPMRLVVPKRYFWKSVKWLDGIEFLTGDERGFWEVRGYHNDAFPFEEQRYSWQERG